MEAEKGHRAISFEICRDFFKTVEISLKLPIFLSNCRDFFQTVEISLKLSRFLSNCRYFFQTVEISFKLSSFQKVSRFLSSCRKFFQTVELPKKRRTLHWGNHPIIIHLWKVHVPSFSLTMFCHRCGNEIRDIFCGNCGTQKRKIIVDTLEKERDIIEYYFRRGFQYESILLFLAHNHALNISLSTLKRR